MQEVPQPFREPTPFPVWRRVLADYQSRLQAYEASGTLHNQLFWEQARTRLNAEVKKPAKFELGTLVMTVGAIELMVAAHQIPEEFLIRHVNGDWGEVSEEQRTWNEQGLLTGDRLISGYLTRRQQKLFTLTEWDRGSTTILRPDEMP